MEFVLFIAFLNTTSFQENKLNLNNTEQQTLNAISRAAKFNRWMYDTIKPYCHGRILEVGSGIGNISSFFVDDNFDITLSDIDDHYLQTLKNKYAGASNVRKIIFLDLQQDNFQDSYATMNDSFDTVFLLNVLEHLKEDCQALHNCRKLLKTGGTLIVLVPAYSWLYSKLDKKLRHYRRYTLAALQSLFNKNQLSVRRQFYFNALGIVAWLYAKIFRLSVVPTGEMNLYNKLVPFAKIVDRLVVSKIGLSAIIIGEK
jgi:2-polyprenyl-3-methyl-5-hydroxy-6-metoxy-1,4-benzoquinol methylase